MEGRAAHGAARVIFSLAVRCLSQHLAVTVIYRARRDYLTRRIYMLVGALEHPCFGVDAECCGEDYDARKKNCHERKHEL